VIGETNTLSLDFEQDAQNYVQVPDDRALDFGNAPFTIEAWVKFETMPTGDNLSSAMPVAMKKVLGSADDQLDYLFLAAAGNYGDAATYGHMALRLGSTVVLSTLAVPDTGWHHISASLDPVANKVRFTLDDQTDLQSTAANGISNSGPLVVGAHFDSSSAVDSSFDGLIDELTITDGFLAPAELQPLMAVVPVRAFRITGHLVAPGGTTFDLTFESDDTRLYSIQKSTDLRNWTDVRTFVPGAAGADETTVSGLPIDPRTSREFFRVYLAE